MMVISMRAVFSGHARETSKPGEGARMAMAAARFWTIEELDSLPDDGNKYEVIDGKLFVTPEPTPTHEHIIARLTRVLDRFAEENGLGMVFGGHSVVRVPGSSVEPDLMVRESFDDPPRPWLEAPIPILVIEVHSPSTRRRDQLQKRDFYARIGVAEYWMIDPVARQITQVRPGAPDVVSVDTVSWRPPGTNSELTLEIAALFGGK
jgi:Uma2 family endonuclease